jgi:hypothetical protein
MTNLAHVSPSFIVCLKVLRLANCLVIQWEDDGLVGRYLSGLNLDARTFYCDYLRFYSVVH